MSVTAVPIRPLKKGSVAKLWIGIAALTLAAGAVAWAGTASHVAADPSSYLARNAARDGVQTTASGLQFEVLQPGTGDRPGNDDLVLVEYEGRLIDGTVFDSSERQGGPTPLPVAGLIPGFTEALQMMQKGGRYKIVIPPALGYGESVPPNGPIPPNAVLEFDVTLVDIAPGAALQMMQGMPPGAGDGAEPQAPQGR
ncbi:MAG: FKBP-type peptidyl-prolyl cis-trans isomerase [Allosphingosinicella sp.]|uniref:FKBP-type peptidyl-prolyl cis-trans isomerase n=1 Tax=Allosphingosinicella sp. TaxID=2823234 RepID=UPI003954D373